MKFFLQKVFYLVLSILVISCAKSKDSNAVFLKITEGDVTYIERYLQEGNSANLKRDLNNNCVYETKKCVGDTLLNTSLLAKEIDISKLLIDHGADFRNQSPSLISPLKIAIELDLHEFVGYLLKMKKIDCGEKIDKYTVIEIARANNSFKTLELLSSCRKRN